MKSTFALMALSAGLSIAAPANVAATSSSAPAPTGTNYGALVAKDIRHIINVTHVLNHTLARLYRSQSNFFGEIIAANTATNNVVAATNQTIVDTEQGGAFTTAGSNQVAAAILNLEPLIISVLNTTVRKKPFFTNTNGQCFDVSGIVLSSLQKQNQQSKDLGAQIARRISVPALASQAPLIQRRINKAFASAISVYQSSTTCTPAPTSTSTTISSSTSSSSSSSSTSTDTTTDTTTTTTTTSSPSPVATTTTTTTATDSSTEAATTTTDTSTASAT